MSHSKKITLDPTLIATSFRDQSEIEAFEQFFNHQQTDFLWNKNQEYQYLYNNITYTFCFTHSLLRRKTERKSKDRFEIFDANYQALGKGGFGIVYPILGTIKFKANKPILKEGGNRIVKVETRKVLNRRERIEKEYRNLLLAGHLGAKEPVFVDNKSFLVMKKASGCTLDELLADEDGDIKLTIMDRTAITFAILNAIQIQVIDKGLIHRDLKPRNIMIDLEQLPPKVTIIDYGNAIKMEELDGRIVGTPSYRSPEAYAANPIYTTKSDSYSTGRILSYLWGDHYENYHIKNGTQWEDIKLKSTNEHLFSHPDVTLFQKDQQIIRSCLNGLMSDNPSDRLTIDQAIAQFSSIHYRKYEMEEIKEYTKKELRYYELSLKTRIQEIYTLLGKLSKKGKELNDRGFIDVAKNIEELHHQLSIHTHSFEEDPDPVFIEEYRNFCFAEMDKSKTLLQDNRDSQWLIGEIIIAIGLLGVGYIVALGINYQLTSRIGLFSKTRSEQLVDNIKDSIYQLSP